MAASKREELARLLLDQIADKWTIRVLLSMCPSDQAVRFNELKRRVAGVSQKTLTQCLRRLERNGLVQRRVIAAAPLGVEYQLSALGRTLEAPFNALYEWAETLGPRVVAAQAAFDRSAKPPADGAVATARMPRGRVRRSA